jgi:acyl-ACP thioesterase
VEPTDLVPAPPAGRVFTERTRTGLGDVTPSGRVRLDAIARWLQDAAFADILDTGLPDDAVWVVRRLRLRVERFPRFGEAVEVATWCSGTGPLWAERRTTVRGEDGGRVEAVALWVHLDPDGLRPRPMPEGFEAVYGPAAGGRRVRARLRHPPVPEGAPSDAVAWRFRAADLDLAAHVNNAAYWEVLEEDLATGAERDEPLDAEIEHRAPGDAGDATVVRDGAMRWITGRDGELLASIALGSPPAATG